MQAAACSRFRPLKPRTWKSTLAETAHHSLTWPCGPKPRQWKASLRLAFHWRGFGPHGRVKEWCAVYAHHSLTQPCGPKPRQWKAGLTQIKKFNKETRFKSLSGWYSALSNSPTPLSIKQ